MNRRSPRNPHMRGAVLIGLLMLVALTGLAFSQFSQSWADQRRRDKEDELLFVGRQFRQALQSYYDGSPGPGKHFPATLEELVSDPRFPRPVRHLRRMYADPIDPGSAWGLIRIGPQIIGVYSQAAGEPVKRADFDADFAAFNGAASYDQWKFSYTPRPAPNTPAPRSTPVPPTPRVPK